MRKVERGDDASELPPQDQWKASEEGCLRRFVEVVAKDKNEHVDTCMLRYESSILEHLRRLGVRRELPAPLTARW